MRALVDPAFNDAAAKTAAVEVLEHLAGPAHFELGATAYASDGGFAYPARVDDHDVVVKVSLVSANEHLATLINWAHHHGDPWLAPTCPPVVSTLGPQPLLVSVWPKGEPSHPDDPHAWVELGGLLGRLHHQRGCGIPVFDPRRGLHDRVAELADGPFSSLAALAAARIDQLSAAWDAAANREPYAVCHGDPHSRQVVRFSNTGALIDADRSGDGPAVSDLAFAWCFEQAGHLADGVWDALVDAYVAHAPAAVLQGDDPAGICTRVLPFARLHLLRRALGLAVRHVRGAPDEKTPDVLAAVERWLGDPLPAG